MLEGGDRGAARARELALAAAFTALGVVLPVLFHMVGLGRYLLPMHVPVLAAGLVLGPRYAWTVGLATPWLSSFLTGMPPAPMAVLMGVELVALSGAASVLAAARTPVWVAAALAVAVRCAVSWGVSSLLAAQLGLPPQAAGWAAVAAGAPGIGLQLVAVPPLAVAVRRSLRARAAVG
jgi:hypothetical protein